MKIQYDCGELIHDSGDGLPHKAHFIPDEQWNPLFEALDQLIENRCHTSTQRNAACMRIRTLISKIARSAWQCRACGRLYIEDTARDLHCHPPGPSGTSRELLSGKTL